MPEELTDEEILAQWEEDEEYDPAQDMFRQEPPDGKYIVEILSAVRGESEATGRPQIIYHFRVLEVIKIKDSKYTEDPEGIIDNEFFKYSGLATPDNRRFVRRELYVLGCGNHIKASELDGVLESLAGKKVKVTIKTKEKDEGTFVSTYFQELVA